jgi:hypothetical protein
MPEISEQARRRALLGELEAALSARAGVEADERARRQARRARPDAPDRPRPLEFDANGFPVRQRTPNFATRVARLLNP